MSESKFVKPSVDGARIPDPAMGDDLPAEGRAVRWSPYWRRLEMRGDVTVGEAKASGDKASAGPLSALKPPARPAAPAPAAAPSSPGAGGA